MELPRREDSNGRAKQNLAHPSAFSHIVVFSINRQLNRTELEDYTSPAESADLLVFHSASTHECGVEHAWTGLLTDYDIVLFLLFFVDSKISVLDDWQCWLSISCSAEKRLLRHE